MPIIQRLVVIHQRELLPSRVRRGRGEVSPGDADVSDGSVRGRVGVIERGVLPTYIQIHLVGQRKNPVVNVHKELHYLPLNVTNGSCWNDSPFKRFTVAGSVPSTLDPRILIPAANAHGSIAESVQAEYSGDIAAHLRAASVRNRY